MLIRTITLVTSELRLASLCMVYCFLQELDNNHGIFFYVLCLQDQQWLQEFKELNLYSDERVYKLLYINY
jgi:hypothetical protein